MERITIGLKIARLVCKQRLFGLTPAEKEELAAYRRQCLPGEDLPILSERLSPAALSERYSAVDTAKEWGVFLRRTRRRRRLGTWTAAACVCLLLVGGFSIWLLNPGKSTITLAREDSRNQISLVLSDGQKIDLSDTTSHSALEPGATLHADRLTYSQDTTDEELKYNTIIIPKGAYYHLILSDGTKVWLNADSKLYYPVHFGKNNREVSLKGEAYFEVAKDTTRPFIVSTEALNVKVLGTHFDVNSYKDDGRVYTALTEGLVEVYNEHSSRLLHPGQMASVDTREEKPSIQVDSCDTSILTGWRDGQFRFRNTSLTQILKQISRCYDVTIILQRDYQEEYYSGDISYHIPLSTLLGAIEASTSVHFDIEGNTVYMRRK